MLYSTTKGMDSNDPNTYSVDEVEQAPYQVVKDYLYSGPEQLPYELVVSFGLGLLFSVWSWGLFLLIVFVILIELVYVLIVQEFTVEYLLVRVAIIGAYVLGWAVGRISIGDRRPFRYYYKDGLVEIGRPGHYHPGLRKRKERKMKQFGRVVMRTDMVKEDSGAFCKYPDNIEEYTNYYDPDPSIYRVLKGEEWNEVNEPILPMATSKKIDEVLEGIMTSCHN
jgi:hypothetical protein